MNEQLFRSSEHGLIDRTRPVSFRFDDQEFTGYHGDTLASALLANGVRTVSGSITYRRPRGIMSAGAEEANALVQIEHPFPEPMLTATTVELSDGLVARGLAGHGRLAGTPDPARYDRRYAHCEILVVGAGPAGLTAALTAARTGARVIVLDDQPHQGGSLLGTAEYLDGRPATAWIDAAVAELRARPTVTLLTRTSAFGYYDDNYVLALQRRSEEASPDVARQRVWHIRARHVVLATGAHEQPIVFTDNDRPGIMLATAARTYLNRYGVLGGRRVVVFTTNDSAYAAAIDLTAAGVEVAAVVDGRATIPHYWAARCAAWHIDVLPGHAVHGTAGDRHLSSVTIGPLVGGSPWSIDCDLLLVSGGWNPAVQLFSQAGGTLRHDDTVGAFVPDAARQRVSVAGAVRGEFTLHGCLADGVRAVDHAIAAAGLNAVEPIMVPETTDRHVRSQRPERLWTVPAHDDNARSRQFVDLARDSTVADVLRAIGAGLHSVEHIKRYTTIGTAHDQGRTSGTTSSGVIAEAIGSSLAELGVTTFRPPYVPVAFAALAGRDRGELLDPARTTSLHPWHLDRGAVFETVGQWLRPRYYPLPGESMDQAVARECQSARAGAGFMDASTLGKIDVHGPDSGEFLDRLYTNMMSSLKVGRIRYGLMCKADGMLFDDGTVSRIGEDRFLVTTTTGNAAAVLDWMEEWLQTEWPDLRVHCTSVTDQFATIALVGPKSRAILGALAPGLDVSNDEFGFMSWRDSPVAGTRARICRISFSGELAYEINVLPWKALAVWEAIEREGGPYGITPYGTETMHVLRAEKGYPIVGQDTDGTVTPYDLGMSWAVSKKKATFVGKRSLTRADTARADRKQFVGLLPADPGLRLEEGAQLVAAAELPPPPVPMLGHVTSSYTSDALGRTFALALVAGGRDRIGDTIYAATAGSATVPVTVTGNVLFDPEGARRDG
ncbi:sarcosine oxidase subunit alpha [Amycolatopsis marina]|uniref:Sarcosine oxidase subunit alpha n=1 Tax=Amycolatopsis marina TaxID=490629 RepID=A0A1I1AYL5_9PSEU|nr:2Fe-2S iron-sulfur cluster-binding protein [Amycolatopsis marina]SFB43189.1 sarcosine oxidase subunit alpha [Amycolatopsis marina]